MALHDTLLLHHLSSVICQSLVAYLRCMLIREVMEERTSVGARTLDMTRSSEATNVSQHFL